MKSVEHATGWQKIETALPFRSPSFGSRDGIHQVVQVAAPDCNADDSAREQERERERERESLVVIAILRERNGAKERILAERAACACVTTTKRTETERERDISARDLSAG